MLPGTLCPDVFDLDFGSAHGIARTSKMDVHQGCGQAADLPSTTITSTACLYVTNASFPDARVGRTDQEGNGKSRDSGDAHQGGFDCMISFRGDRVYIDSDPTPA